MKDISNSILQFYSEKKYRDKTYRLYQLEAARAIHAQFRTPDLILRDGLRQYTHFAQITLVFSKKSGFLIVNAPSNEHEIFELFLDITDEIGILTLQLSDIEKVFDASWDIYELNSNKLQIKEYGADFEKYHNQIVKILDKMGIRELSAISNQVIDPELIRLLRINLNEYTPNLHEILFGSFKLVTYSNIHDDY